MGADGVQHTAGTGMETMMTVRTAGQPCKIWLEAMLGEDDDPPRARGRNRACLGCLP